MDDYEPLGVDDAPVLCSDEPHACHPICDFCKHYDFDKRYCNLKKDSYEPCDGCDRFHCYTLEEQQQ